MDSEVTVSGLKELQEQLDKLPSNVERKLMRGALRAGMRVLLLRARQLIHSVTGELAKSLRIITRAKAGVVTAVLKAGNKKAFYAHMVEFGTAAHLIAASKGKAITIGGHIVADARHPGAKPEPFMRPALDSQAVSNSEALRAVADYLAPRINDQLDKLPDETK